MEPARKVIIVGDCSTGAELLLGLLRQSGFDPGTIRVEQEVTLISALETPTDLVLSDFDLPQLNGLRVIEVVKAHAPEVPVIFVSGSMHADAVTEAMKRGAAGFILKNRLTRIEQAVDAVWSQSGERRNQATLEAQQSGSQRLESVSRLASGVAHDLNNILVPVLMGAGMLGARIRDPDQQSIIETIEASARRGAAIVKQLLQFSRVAVGTRVPVQPETLVKDMRDIMRETFPKNIMVRTRLADVEGLGILGDPPQLHQVLMNLCANARDAMPQGGDLELAIDEVEVDASTPVTAGQPPRPGRFLAISVKDTGKGIPAEDVESVFDPFFTTKEAGRGAGLGLSTVLGIVKNHDGFIQIETGSGQGTEFKLFFPARSTEEVATQQQPSHSFGRGRSELILVVDDEAPIRALVHRVLKSAGYRSIEAHDGAEGISKFVEYMHEVRLVLTDVMMPNTDGVGLLRAIRALDPQMHVIATSGAGGSSKLEALRRLGISAFMNKPFTREQLLAEVEHLLQRGKTVS